MAELKPCPFCGGKAEYKNEEREGRSDISYVFCENCGARGEYFLVNDVYSSKDYAIEAWNRRAEDAVEVVRCCDCQNCTVFQQAPDSEVLLFCEKRKGHPMVDPTDFCSYGERKGDGNV